MAGTGDYTAADIQVLVGLEGVRRRPGMYIGSTDNIYPLLWEVLGNALDECLAGTERTVTVSTDGARVTVEDDGTGIALDRIEQIFTRLMWDPTLHRKHRHISAALRGAGVAVTSALSRELVVTVWRDGKTARQRFERGIACGPLALLAPTTRTGTRITFEPDFTIMKEQPWDVSVIAKRCRELAGLEPGLAISVNGERFHYASLGDYVRDGREVVVAPFQCDVVEEDVGVRAAIAWHDGKPSLRTFVNGSLAAGDYVAAFERAIAAAFVNRVRRKRNVRRGRLAVLHVMLDDPRWGSPTREWLKNPEVAGIVERVIERELARHLDEAPALLDALLLRWELSAARARARPSTARPRTRPRTPAAPRTRSS
jgi:DNA gyrase subunit B